MFGPCELKQDSAELRAIWYAVSRQMLPSESDSHRVGKKVSTSVQAYVSSSYYQVLPPSRKRHPCISYWKKICLKQTVCSDSTEVTTAVFWSCKHSFHNHSFIGYTEQLVFSMYFTKAQTNACSCLGRGCMCRSVLSEHSWLKAAAHTHFTQKRSGNTFFLEINVASPTRDTCRRM